MCLYDLHCFGLRVNCGTLVACSVCFALVNLLNLVACLVCTSRALVKILNLAAVLGCTIYFALVIICT